LGLRYWNVGSTAQYLSFLSKSVFSITIKDTRNSFVLITICSWLWSSPSGKAARNRRFRGMWGFVTWKIQVLITAAVRTGNRVHYLAYGSPPVVTILNQIPHLQTYFYFRYVVISPHLYLLVLPAKFLMHFLSQLGMLHVPRISPSLFCPSLSKECKLWNCWPFQILKYSVTVVSVRTALCIGHWLYRCTSRGVGDVLMASGNSYLCVIVFSLVEIRNGVFQASPPTQLFGEAERDGAAGTRGIPTHYARAAHESEAVYQGIYWFFIHLRLVYCCPNCNNRTHVPNSLQIRVFLHNACILRTSALRFDRLGGKNIRLFC